VLCIAHSLSTIRRASQIIVMDRGRIVARGTHEQLLEHDTSGLYATLLRDGSAGSDHH
jgi:ABC-type multidrug transport system fused ATPase/permease subunit